MDFKELNKTMRPLKMKVIYLLGAFLVIFSIEASAQNNVEVKGVPADIEKKVSVQSLSLLKAIETGDYSAWSDDHVSEEFRSKVSDMDLITDQGTVYTMAVSIGEAGYELNGALMRSAGMENSIHELVFHFGKSGDLKGVEFGDMLSNSAWIVSRDIQVKGSNTLDMLEDVLKNYEQSFNQKDPEALKELFMKNGYVISSTENASQNGLRSVKRETKAYINHIEENIFRPDNEINVSLSDARFYHHPDQDKVFGIAVRQTWISRYYADQGYLFLVVDARGGEPKIYSRVWQVNPFRQTEYLIKELDQYELNVKSLAPSFGAIPNTYNGDIEFRVESQLPGLFTPEYLAEVLDKGSLIIRGVDLDLQLAELTDENLIIPFTADFQNGEQMIERDISFSGNTVVESFNGSVKLYAERRNVIQFKIGNRIDEQESPNYFGAVNLTFNTDSVRFRVNSEFGRELLTEVVQDSSISLDLLEGTYFIYATKPGYISEMDTVIVPQGQNLSKTMNLESIFPKQSVAERKTKGFFARNKRWIISGAAAVVTSTALILTAGGSESPGIPIPPGRPAWN